MPLVYSAGVQLETWRWRRLYQGLGLSAMWKLIHTVRLKLCKGSKTVSSTTRLFGMISERSTDCPLMAKWISSLEVSPVNHSLALARTKEQMTIETCGQRPYEPLAKFDPDTHSWKTFQISLLTNTLDKFSQTWPRSGIIVNSILYQRRSLVQTTDESGRGFWLTPSTIQITPGSERREKRTKYRKSIGRQDNAGCLVEQVMEQKFWPTITVNGNANKKEYSPKAGDGLLTAVKRADLPYPTPRGGEGGVGLCGGTGSREMLQSLKDAGQITEEERLSMQSGSGGQLNPVWVERLMGFPIGWTSLEPIDKELLNDWLEMFQNYGFAESWADGSWEDGISRLREFSPERAKQLKMLGNAWVVQVVQIILKVTKIEEPDYVKI